MFTFFRVSLFITITTCVGNNLFLHDYGAYTNGEKNVSCAEFNGWSLYQTITDSRPGDHIILRPEKSCIIYLILKMMPILL